MTPMMIAGIVFLTMIMIIVIYNGLIGKKNQVENAFAGMDVQTNIGHSHIVIDRLGKGQNIQPILSQAPGIFLGAVSSQTDQTAHPEGETRFWQSGFRRGT